MLRRRASPCARRRLWGTSASRTRPLITLHSCRSSLVTSLGGRVGALWAGLARSLTLTDAASRILTFGVVDLSSRGSSQPSLPLLDASFYSSATPKAFIIHQTHCVSHCCRASPRYVASIDALYSQHANAHETHCRRTGSTKERGAESQSGGGNRALIREGQ
jgi:hypothetical protein